MYGLNILDRSIFVYVALCVMCQTCQAQLLPRFDPTGRTIFAPRENTAVSAFGQPQPNPQGPVWQHPADPLPCAIPVLPSAEPIGSRIVPQLPPVLSPTPVENDPRTCFKGRAGAVSLTPEVVVAPVGSEVVLLAGICGPNGYYVMNQPIEWVMSQESVGNFVDVSEANNEMLGQFLQRNPRKITSGFAKGRTGSQAVQLSRGTPTLYDDVLVQKGQAWASVTSASEGTTHITVLAPEADGWDQRRKTATIHWMDATWTMPPSAYVKSGQAHPLTVKIARPSDGSPVEDWIVRYEIVNSNIPVGFAPTGSGKAEVRTNSNGEATVYIRQQTAETLPGTAQVRTEIIRPPFGTNTKPLRVAESDSLISWTAPALEIQATGPENAGRDTVVNYHLEVRNPGNSVARDVTVSTEIPEGLEFVSANPKASVYGHRLEWRLGDLPPQAIPYAMDVQLKTTQQGTKRTCFEAASIPDNLRTDACIDTFVAVPCLAMRVSGPSQAQTGDQLSYKIEISNECEQDLAGMQLEVNFDEGFEAPGHTSPMVYGPISEPLRFGETKVVELTLIPRKSGTRCFNLNATSDGGHTATGQKCVEVTAVPEPAVDIEIVGPDRADVGKTAKYVVTVTNTGNVTLHDLDVTAQFSDSLEPNFATTGYYWKDDGLAWRYRELAPGNTIDLTIVHSLIAADPNAINLVKLQTAEGASDQDQALTFVQTAATAPPRPSEGPTRIPEEAAANRLKVTVVGLNNPVRVGDTASYQVVVKNDRNVPDQNVALMLEIPPGMQYVPNNGVREAQRSADGRQISLVPQREMRAGDEIRFIVQLKALQPGTQEFKVRATSTLSDGAVEDAESISIDQ